MKICFIPIDNRPVCYNLALDITSVDDDIELIIPPRDYLGNLHHAADISKIYDWLKTVKNTDAMVLSLDTLMYGGLIPSRRSRETMEDLKVRAELLKEILENSNSKKIYAFSSIMRISNNNCNEEEKPYWANCGEKIFEYSYKTHQGVSTKHIHIPKLILDDYLNTRKRNFEINKMYLEWQKDGLFDTLIFSKDDCAKYGFNVQEAQELEMLGGKTKTGADEIPLSLLARAIEKNIKIYVEYTEPEHKDKISNYEDVSIEKSVLGQLDLAGFKVMQHKINADIVLLVNNFIEKQGELVMNWDTEQYNKELELPDKPYAIADVRYANGSDNAFVEQLLPKIDLNQFYGYAGWNTSANTLGTILALIKVKYNAKKYNDNSFKRLQMIRFLDDWAYQANIRGQIQAPCNIREQMIPYTEILTQIFDYTMPTEPIYHFPWNRKFEVEVII